jgi:hypothetical protein
MFDQVQAFCGLSESQLDKFIIRSPKNRVKPVNYVDIIDSKKGIYAIPVISGAHTREENIKAGSIQSREYIHKSVRKWQKYTTVESFASFFEEVLTPNPEGAGLIWKTAKRGKGVGEDIPSPLEAGKMKEMTKVGLIGSHSTDIPTEQGMVILFWRKG